MTLRYDLARVSAAAAELWRALRALVVNRFVNLQTRR